MFQKARDTSYLESTSLLFLLVRWRKPLMIILLLTITAAFIFTSSAFITPKFKSTVIFFPAATNSVSKALLEESSSEKQDILAFGEEEQAEQMLQILNSDEIRDHVINKYNLMDHYQIDKNSSYPQTKLCETYKENISYSRTEFMSVRIDVMDADPQMAANIANDIASYLDSMKTKIQKNRAQEALGILKTTFESKQIEINMMEDSLMTLRNKGVMDFTSQTEILNSEYTRTSSMFAGETASLQVLKKYKDENDSSIINTRARIESAEARMKNVKQQLDNLAKYGGASVSLNEALTLQREELSRLKKQYDKLAVDANQNLTAKFIVNTAVKAEKKSYPVRWLIVLVSAALSLILSIVVLLIFEKVREIKYNL